MSNHIQPFVYTIGLLLVMLLLFIIIERSRRESVRTFTMHTNPVLVRPKQESLDRRISFDPEQSSSRPNKWVSSESSESSDLQVQIARDCARMISFFPIDFVMDYDSFWESYNVKSEDIEDFIIAQCMRRLNLLYELEDKPIADPTITTNKQLVVMDLELTLTASFTLNQPITDSIANKLFQYNDMNLAFTVISDQVVHYRYNLMLLLDLCQRGFDFGIYANGNYNQSLTKHNAVAMETFYNWIYLPLQYVTSKEEHLKRLFRFKFVYETPTNHAKKSINQLMRFLSVSGSYDHIIILDDESSKRWMSMMRVWVPRGSRSAFDEAAKFTKVVPIIPEQWEIQSMILNGSIDSIDRSDTFMQSLAVFLRSMDSSLHLLGPRNRTGLAQWITIDVEMVYLIDALV
eukprot:90996_1